MASRYFDIKELVCPDVYNIHGHTAWKFLDHRLLKTLDIVREKIIGRPIVVNNWAAGGELTQRGLRCNLCPIVAEKSRKKRLYLSAHCLGKAVDFSVAGLPAENARRLIIEHQELLPYPIRLEKNVDWVHLDMYDDKGEKITLFEG